MLRRNVEVYFLGVSQPSISKKGYTVECPSINEKCHTIRVSFEPFISFLATTDISSTLKKFFLSQWE